MFKHPKHTLTLDPALPELDLDNSRRSYHLKAQSQFFISGLEEFAEAALAESEAICSCSRWGIQMEARVRCVKRGYKCISY